MSVYDMNFSERASYLKGLAEGLELDKSKPEGKLIDAMLDLIYDITEELEMVKDDIETMQDDILDIEAEDFDEDFDADDYYDFDEDNPDYEVVCPDCGAEVVVDEDTLIEGEINCPNCGNVLEFDFSSLFDADKDDSEEELPF